MKKEFLIFAHRGARSLAPENTLAAARAALAVGADGWELDVRLSRDGVPVVIHDGVLTRTSDVLDRPEFSGRKPWRVEDFDLAELKSLDFGSWFSKTRPFGRPDPDLFPGPGSEVSDFSKEKIPTFEEALFFSAQNGLLVNVEVKDIGHGEKAAKLLQRTVEIIVEQNMIPQTILSSFKGEYLLHSRALRKDLATGLISDQVLFDPLAVLKKWGARAYHPSRKVFDPEGVLGLKASGRLVNIWTVNEIKEMDRWARAGVNGIMTDFPQLWTP